MIGRIYKNKADGKRYKVTGDDNAGRWILTTVDEFSGNRAFTPSQIQREFTRAGDVEPTATHSYEAETAGWARLSAEQQFAARAMAAEAGDLQDGDYLTHPGVSGEQVPAREPLTKDDISILKRHARRLRGTVKEPTPEEVFAETQRETIDAAADRVWSSNGPDGLLARYEIGALEVSPAVATVLDARIKRRDREYDRKTYPNHHVIPGSRRA